MANHRKLTCFDVYLEAPHKKCGRCKRILAATEFGVQSSKRDGLSRDCRLCRRIQNWATYAKHSTAYSAKAREYRVNNRSHYLTIRRAYDAKTMAEDPSGNAEIKRNRARYYMRDRLQSDPAFRILARSRHRLWEVLKRTGAAKAGKTVELLGCTPEFLKGYIEAQFQPGWTWADWGTLFEIDHRMPCSKFDMKDPVQQKECFHYTNLQPLDKNTNRSKWNKILPEHLPIGQRTQ